MFILEALIHLLPGLPLTHLQGGREPRRSPASRRHRRQRGAGRLELAEACLPSCCLQALLAKADPLISSDFQGKEERSSDG